MRKLKILITILILTLFLPVITQAQDARQTETFEARVIEILDEQELIREDGSVNLQQNLKLTGLSGEWKDKEFEFFGISEFDVVSAKNYKINDKVIVARGQTPDGKDIFYVTDHSRATSLYWLIFIFVIIVVAVGKIKGLRSLASLLASFAIIIYFMLPKILAGSNPLIIGVIGSFFILIILIYITEGFNIKSHLAIIAILTSLLIVSLLSIAFTYIARLSGMAQEEILFLVDAGKGMINFSGLLLAGILIGTLGAMDDVVISQIEAVAQLKAANPNLSRPKIFQMAFEIGRTHMGAMINTLFLAYAGASLPLLLLFSLKQEPFLSFNQIINQEMIAVEIVRTIIGSIGIVLAIPIATMLAVYATDIKIDKHSH